MPRGSVGSAIGFRVAIRTLVRNPGPSLLVVLTLAVAIAATTVVYSALDVLLHFVPGAAVDRLAFVASTDPRPSESQSGVYRGVAWTGVSQPDLADWIARATSFEEFAAFRSSTATLTGLDAALRVATMRATPNLLRLWGMTPAAGRAFRSQDGRPGAEPVAIVTESFFRRELTPQGVAVGSSVLLDGVAHTVIGVLPVDAAAGFFRDVDLIVPLRLDPARAPRDDRRLFTIARLAPGVTMDQARGELEAIVTQLQAEYPRTNARTGVVVRPHIEQLGGNIPFLMFLMALMAGLVVAVACANVSGIMLAQGAARQRELAIRSALGAGRVNHMLRLMTENVVLAGTAGVIALVLAQWGISGIRWLAGDTPNIFGALALNSRVLVVGLLASALVPFGFGLMPAWRVSRVGLVDIRRATRGGTDPSSRRTRQLLVAVQVGLAMVLMVQVSLLVRTTWRFHHADNGFDPAQLLTFRVELPEDRYSNAPRITEFYQEALRQIEALPGVASAAVVSSLPMADREVTIRPLVAGAAPVAPESLPFAALTTISDGYLQTMRIPIRRGRGLDATDLADARPAAVVSEEAARRLWPDRDALGQRVTVNLPSAPDASLEVVGIVGNVRTSVAENSPTAQIYVPASWYAQRGMAIAVRTAGTDPLPITAAVRERVAGIDRSLPIFRINTMAQSIATELTGGTILTVLLGAIAAIALGLACAGVYGTVAHAVQLRRREIGIRMALGARPKAVLRMIVRHGTAPVTVGGVLGFAGALALASAMASSVDEVEASDPAAYAAVVIVIAIVTLLATYIPARRASGVDPAITLRAE